MFLLKYNSTFSLKEMQTIPLSVGQTKDINVRTNNVCTKKQKNVIHFFGCEQPIKEVFNSLTHPPTHQLACFFTLLNCGHSLKS
jgi:hypothetical protein